jgi:C4-type Zn-finger protein
LCHLLGHNWDLEPPWSGKEIRYNPECQRCGHRPEEIAITGSHEGGHRV